jgi:AraC family transcriptional regulator of adaptative response / DNA-3-methyladenine glycosylase II
MSTTPAAVESDDPLFAERFRAMSSRDSRFDGQFITGVHSTGIYCRPSCPAMTPKPGNVTFYRTAAAAHEAGLRACKRCLPDAVPGSPEWNVGDDVASRAMRLIADGTVEREGVTGLADSLGYTSRHLGRLLQRELGAGPLALARAHRAQTARALLVETALPVADVAFAAGFASIRQFNETVRAVYELTPTELRQRKPRAADAAAAPGPDGKGTTITLHLPAREPFDAAGLLNYFALHAVTGMEMADGTSFRRGARLPHGVAEVVLDFAQDSSGITCTATLTELSDLGALVARVRRLLDLDADSAAIDDALRLDGVLAPLVRAVPGIRVPGSLDNEETLFRTMIGQQVSIAAARTVSGRIAAELSATPGLFPTALEIAENGHEVLRGPSTRVAAILGVARAIAGGDLQLDVGTPVDEFRAALERLPGIGPWTSGYLAMRVLGSPDILLTTDLVMLANASKLGLPASARGLAQHGERFAPWRSYAGMHLWRAAGPLAAP